MSKRRRYSFWIDEEHLAGLREIRDRVGVLESEQIRRALAAWLKKHDRPTGRSAARQGRTRDARG